MTSETLFVFGLIAFVAVLMASNKIRFDIIAVLVVISLMLSGVLTVGEALAGFGSSVVMLVAALLVVGEMLDRTGVARAVGDLILRKGGHGETKLLVLIMISAAFLGAVMSSTAVVAIFIPIILRIAAETGLNRSRLLLPMSYAALVSGMLTLIATTPNIVVHDELRNAGFKGFSFFSFTPVGLVVLAATILYILFLGRKFLPASHASDLGDKSDRPLSELAADYIADAEPVPYFIGENSSFAGKTISENKSFKDMGLRVLGLKRPRSRGGHLILAAKPDLPIRGGDTILLLGSEDKQTQFGALPDVSPMKLKSWMRKTSSELGAVAVLIHPESSLIGKSIREAGFQERFSLQVIGIRRNGAPLPDFADSKLRSSDSLLVVGTWGEIESLNLRAHEFVVLEEPREKREIAPSYRKMGVALALLAAMVTASILDIAPLTAIVLITALLAVLTRCLTMEDSYRSIHWSSVVLVAGMLPLADALTATGGTQIIVDGLMNVVGDAGPGIMLTVLFFLTAGIGLFLSNTASAVLVAPIAITAANQLDVSPYAFCAAVVIAASAAFATPVSTPVVTLVVEPGRYRFTDFVKIGLPLQVIAWLVTLLVTPLVFPY